MRIHLISIELEDDGRRDPIEYLLLIRNTKNVYIYVEVLIVQKRGVCRASNGVKVLFTYMANLFDWIIFIFDYMSIARDDS